jgi:biopolymer transport protein ExbD
MASRTESRDDYEITGINVTPMVDIMLVLLIIFMVTATYIVREAIRVELPQAATAGESTARTLQLVVAKDGRTYLDGVEMTSDALVRRIREAPEKREDLQAVIAADREALHGRVVKVLDLLRSEGVTKFAIQVEREQ